MAIVPILGVILFSFAFLGLLHKIFGDMALGDFFAQIEEEENGQEARNNLALKMARPSKSASGLQLLAV